MRSIDKCEWVEGSYPDDACDLFHTHLVISHEYPTIEIIKSCRKHVLIQASQFGMSTFTVVDVRMHQQEEIDAADYSASLMEDRQKEENNGF